MNSHDDASAERNQQPAAGQASNEFATLSLELEAQFSQGDAPDLKDLLKQLERVPKEQRRILLDRFKSLSSLSSEPSGHKPESDSNKGRGQDRSHSISDLLVDNAASRDTDAGQVTVDFRKSAQRLGKYTLVGELGRGGMGVVYRARHHERDDVVALKVLPSVDGASLHRFKRKFRSLADISHPNLVGLRTLEESDGNWFFTMDLVEEARTFRSFVRPSGELDESRLRNSLAQLVEGVHALHGHGVIHRDLKPSNVLVDRNGRVVIMDFGLVRELNRHDQTVTAQDISGTPAYMAPESAGGGEDTFASDWYAVGVMLYEALCGRLPFSGNTLQILSDKRTCDAPPLPEAEEIPANLRDLCTRLLDRKPTRRPAYEDILASLRKLPRAVESPAKHENALLGRNWQLSSLRNHPDKVQATERPMVCFVSGKSGEGKSALVEKFLQELRKTEDVIILAGRCYDRESVPFKALDSLIDALASFLRTMETADSAVLLPDDTGFLASVFPVLGRVEVVAKRPAVAVKGLDDQQVRKRAFAALRELLRRICLQSQVVFFSDDLQWGDADSAEVLNDVLSGTDAPKLLFIGSFRSDEGEDSPFLKAWYRYQQQALVQESIECVDVSVGPLTLGHCVQLIAGRLKISESD